LNLSLILNIILKIMPLWQIFIDFCIKYSNREFKVSPLTWIYSKSKIFDVLEYRRKSQTITHWKTNRYALTRALCVRSTNTTSKSFIFKLILFKLHIYICVKISVLIRITSFLLLCILSYIIIHSYFLMLLIKP